MTAKITAKKQRRGRPFARGQSGNVAGRPRGARNRATILAEALSDNDLSAIVRAVVVKARKGDMVAAKIALDRMWPIQKNHKINFGEIPEVAKVEDVLRVHSTVIRSVAAGTLSSEGAEILSGLLQQQLKMIDAIVTERRLAALEQQIASEHGTRPNEESN